MRLSDETFTDIRRTYPPGSFRDPLVDENVAAYFRLADRIAEQFETAVDPPEPIWRDIVERFVSYYAAPLCFRLKAIARMLEHEKPRAMTLAIRDPLLRAVAEAAARERGIEVSLTRAKRRAALAEESFTSRSVLPVLKAAGLVANARRPEKSDVALFVNHPNHLQAVASVLGPLRKRRRCVIAFSVFGLLRSRISRDGIQGAAGYVRDLLRDAWDRDRVAIEAFLRDPRAVPRVDPARIDLAPLMRAHGLSPAWAAPIADYFLETLNARVLPLRARSLAATEALLREIRPNAAIIPIGLGSFPAVTAAACRATRVRIVSIQHGLIGYAYEPQRPIPVDALGVWGDSTKDYWIRMGIEPARIRVLGSSHFDSAFPPGPHPPPVPRVLCYTTQATGKLPRMALLKQRTIEILLEFLAKDEGWRMVIRRHPLDAATAELAAIDAAPPAVRGRVSVSQGRSLREDLVASAAVFSISSTTGIEALALGRPLITLAVEDFRGLYDHVVEAGVAFAVSDPSGVARALEAAGEAAAHPEWRAKVESALVYYLSARDGKAEGRTLEYLLEVTRADEPS